MFAKKMIIDTIGLIIFGSFFMYILSLFLGVSSPYIYTTTQYNGIELTYIDTALYARTLNAYFNISNIGELLRLDLPSRQWISNGADVIYIISNNIAVIFDWLYMPINIVLWVFRLIAFVFYSTFMLLGMTPAGGIIVNGQTYQPEWFMTTLNWIVQNLAIPYI